MADESSNQPPEPAVVCQLRDLVRLAQGGDASALPRIREILDAHPEIWGHAGDIAAMAERTWIAVLATRDPVVVESMRRTVAEIRADLGGDRPTRLVRLLVDQVIATYLECKHVEAMTASDAGASLDQAAFRLKRLESAQKRYQGTIKALTEVEKLEVVPELPRLRIFEPKRRTA
jgi:hypothetical protein